MAEYIRLSLFFHLEIGGDTGPQECGPMALFFGARNRQDLEEWKGKTGRDGVGSKSGPINS